MSASEGALQVLPDASDLWSFSLALYAMPGMADACLTAQDRHGADVNLLLWAVWLAAQGHDLTAAEVAEAEAVVSGWREEIIRPLRALRRRLKNGPPPAPDAATEMLRTQIKAAELAAEQQQQSMLSALPAIRRRADDRDSLVRANLSLLPGGGVLAATLAGNGGG